MFAWKTKRPGRVWHRSFGGRDGRLEYKSDGGSLLKKYLLREHAVIGNNSKQTREIEIETRW